MHAWARFRLANRLWLALLGVLASATCVWGQWNDSFEGGEPRWLLVESDCQAQLTEHEISLLVPHGGRTCELMELACAHGSLALLAYPIEPCTIIPEFRPRLWTRCSSGRIRLGVRVIFPFAAHPVTGGRLTTILWGDSYSDPGQWQMLQVDDMISRMNEETVAIRKRFGPEIRLDGAYLDCVVVNAYTGPGRYRFQIDDLELRGMVTMAAIGNPPPADWRENWRWRYETPSAESRFWSAPNAPPVWLQYRGEELLWVKSLGFSGVVTDQLPSREYLTQLQQANLGIISPPPSYAVEFADETLPFLKGWLIGAALDSRQTDLARQQAERVSALPTELHKPLIAEALEDYFEFSRVADEVIVPQPIPTSAGSPREKIAWLSAQLSVTKQRNQGWVSVNLGIPPTLVDQYKSALQLVAPESDASDVVVDPLGFRIQVVHSILGGAKGFLWRTFRPLDIQNNADSTQIAAVRWIQSDLRLWGPWIVAGQPIQPPVLSDSNWISNAWRVADSELVILETAVDGSQFCVPPTFASPIELQLTTSAVGQQVFRLTGGSLERLETDSTPVGLKWRVARPAPIESFLISASPSVIHFARGHLERNAARNAADQLEIVSYNLGLAANLVTARNAGSEITEGNPRIPTQLLSQAQRQIDSGLQALQTGQTAAATQLALEASDTVQTVLYDGFQSALTGLQSPQSSPLITTPASLHLHWQIADACRRSQWRELPLPGSQFSDLNSLLSSGWSQQRRLEDAVNLHVELLPPTQQRAAGLRMAAYSRRADREISGGFEGASLRVRSAASPVRAGQLLRVVAQARIVNTSSEPGCGLLVYDNQVGPSLGQLVRGRVGEVVPVELYRFVVADGEFRLLAECRGECDIVLESVQLSVIEPATNRRSYVATPLNPTFLDVPIDQDAP